MKCSLRMIASVVFLLTGCQVSPPAAKDTTPPDITVFVSRGRGNNIFRSIDTTNAGSNCIIVPELPTQLIMVAGDAGGIESATISAGRIVPESVDVTPRAPEGSFSVRSVGLGDSIIITLTPPSPTTVRTGATAVFETNGVMPVAVSAWARDRSGNTTTLPQFDIRTPETAAVCRGR